MSKRLLFNLTIIISIILLPWWVTLLCAVAFVIFVDRYYELILFGAIYDVIYGVQTNESLMYYGTLIGIILFVISVSLKNRIIKL